MRLVELVAPYLQYYAVYDDPFAFNHAQPVLWGCGKLPFNPIQEFETPAYIA